MRSILACALLCAATMQASAQYPNGLFVDGNELMTWCGPRNVAGPSDPLCLGYVAGVSDAANFSRQLTGRSSNTNCIPPGITIVQKQTWWLITSTAIQTNAILRRLRW